VDFIATPLNWPQPPLSICSYPDLQICLASRGSAVAPATD